MPIEFTQQPSGGSGHITRLAIAYDGSGRRISKTAMRKVGGGDWDTTLVTHYTGIGTEVREYKPTNFARYTDSAGVEHCVSADPDYGGNASTTCPLPDTVKVAVPLPRGLGRYALQDAATVDSSLQGAYEFYLKDHLGSTRMVYGVGYPDPFGLSPLGTVRAAYDYRSFGEQLDLLVFTRKVTENFTGKEKDDETELDYFGARYLDPMLGVWNSVDPMRQFASPYLYAGNGMNPVNIIDPDGNETHVFIGEDNKITEMQYNSEGSALAYLNYADGRQEVYAEPAQGSYFYAKSNGVDFDVVGQAFFDSKMNSNANIMMNSWFNENKWTEFSEWGSGGLYDFKSQFYKGAENTVGIVNGTIMTARDVGNALWGGITSYQYGLTWLGMHVASDAAAGWGALSKQGVKMQIYGAIGCGIGRGTCEDYTSRAMQDWGYLHDFGKPH